MPRETEKNAETLIQENLHAQGWDLTDFDTLTKGYTIPSGKEADYAVLFDGKPVAIIEAKKPGKDLYAALAQAKDYASEIGVILIFASDGEKILRQNLQARTLPEEIPRFPTLAELKEFFNPVAAELYGTLRDYQKVAVSQALAAVQSGREKFYLQMATASGKTIVAAGIVAKLFSVGLLRKTLFIVDRDGLADQTVEKFTNYLGDNFKVLRLTGNREDRFADICVTTVQFLATNQKHRLYPSNFFDLVILDECHRSYFGDWHPVVEHFRSGGAWIVGLTATPSDKETQNTDHYFGPPVFRYTWRQGVQDGYLADCKHYKYCTNVDLEGVHDMGFDFEPEQLGRAVDVPQRTRLIAEKYFELIGSEPAKTLVFAASIPHAKNLRYALIEKYNELHNLRPSDATAEEFIVAIHNEMHNAKDLLREFQKVRAPDERLEILEKARNGKLTSPVPLVAVSIDMLSTGIDAPDIDVLLMARPTKSKVLYVQMKGRGTRKCKETGKETFLLIDFVDLARIEEVITNDTPGVEDALPEEVEIPRPEEKKPEEEKEKMEVHRQEMVIADVPVWLVSSEVIAPQTLQDLKRQIESQIKPAQDKTTGRERFCQAVLAWSYLKGEEPMDPRFLSAMGFDLETLRDLYGETEATFEEFIAVARGEKRFLSPEERKRQAVICWAEEQKKLNNDQLEFFLILYDFKQKNPELTVQQLFKSQLLAYRGGLPKVKTLFGDLKSFLALYEEAKEISPLDYEKEEHHAG